jgi:hypothetical protein
MAFAAFVVFVVVAIAFVVVVFAFVVVAALKEVTVSGSHRGEVVLLVKIAG